jgi:hypothetical protein
MRRAISHPRGLVGATLAFAAIAFTLSGPSPSIAKDTVPANVKTCDQPTTWFCDALMPPTPDWKGHVFKLAQNYPAKAPNDITPWTSFDPYTEPRQYLQAALGYFYEGNIRPSVEDSFSPKLNWVRRWYNAPWQDYGTNGREFVHGLTRERVSQPGELDPAQTKKWNNYAVGFYNAPGGEAIGKMWANHGAPNADLAQMPEGTVGAKLLFTTAPVSEVPFLAGSPEWDAYVYADPNDTNPSPTSPRAVMKVRLLQIDIAVKDSRAKETGWIFGTFVYGGGPGGQPGNGWFNVAPVGVMWGNDPGYSGSGPLTQTWLNPEVHMPHVGYQGRLNGPVDNPISSCMSCHATAELPQGTMVPPRGSDPAPWFQNIKSGTPFDAGRKPLDYSLQIEVGFVNFLQAHPVAKPKSLTLEQVQQVHIDRAKPLSRGGEHE